jgi:hypothetical protein
MDEHEIESGGVDWIFLAQGRDKRRSVLKAVMFLQVPENAGNLLTG